MNRLLPLSLLFLLVSWGISAQITVDNSTLPELGDVLTYRTFSNFQDSSFVENGENLSWSFDNFELNDTITETYRDISSNPQLDSLFPEANIIWDAEGIQSAAVRTENSIDIIGIENLGIPFLGDQSIAISYNLRTTPLNYGDSSTSEFTIPITVAADIIPGLDSLEIPFFGSPDSVRILTNNKTESNVTAWGMLDLQGVTYDVLKVEERDSTTFEIEFGLEVFGNFNWINLADLLAGLGGDLPGGGGLEDFGLGDTADLTYRFISNDTKFSLVEFNINEVLDTNGIVTDVFISGQLGESLGMVVAAEEVAQPESLRVFPNPTSTHFWLDPTGSSRIAEHLKIYNTNGQCVSSLQNHPMDQPIDVDRFAHGQYFLIGVIDNELFSSKISVIK